MRTTSSAVPLARENELRYQLISNDPQVMDLAERTGLTPASILKLRAIIDMRRSDVFDAQDLADCLEVTVRSARASSAASSRPAAARCAQRRIPPAGGGPSPWSAFC